MAEALSGKALPRPEPSAGVEEYEWERAACLSLDPRRRENWDRYRASDGMSATVDYLPVKLDIENVGWCNFKNVIDEHCGLVEIALDETALSVGDECFEFIRYARSKRIWVRMDTNASLLNVRNNYRKLIDSGVNEIDISVDGADKATFEAIVVGSKFERVVANCKLLNDYARSRNVRRTRMWTMVREQNHRRLDEHVILAMDLGFRHLVFNLIAWRDTINGARLWSLVDQGARAGVRVSFLFAKDE